MIKGQVELPLRLGVAGLGFGAAVHLPAFQAIPGVKIVGLASTSLAKCRALAARENIPHAYDDYRQLFELPLDAVSLCLPPSLSAEACTLALQRGLEVLSEKPLGTTLAEARRLLDFTAGRITGVDFQFAELEIFQEFRQAIKSLSSIHKIELSWQVESYAHQHRQWSWKTDARAGGGVMPLLGSHALFLLEWLCGPVSLPLQRDGSNQATQNFTPMGEWAADDTVCLTGKLVTGIPFRLEISNARPATSLHRWSIEGDPHCLVLENTSLDYMHGFSLTQTSETVRTLLYNDPLAEKGVGRFQAFSRLARRFVSAVKDQTPFSPDFAVGIRVQELMGERSLPELA